MTDKEKLEKIQSLADKMYTSMQNLTTDTAPIRKAMNEYHQFIIQHLNNEEPVSEDLEEAAKDSGQRHFPDEYNIWARPNYEAKHAELAFMEGAHWQKKNLWKDAQGDDLPEIDREVIALQGRKVVFAHRPPEYWDGKNIATGEITRHYPQTYDKGGWNIPGVTYWLDVQLSEGIE